jgi:hypothetical protein
VQQPVAHEMNNDADKKQTKNYLHNTLLRVVENVLLMLLLTSSQTSTTINHEPENE